MKFHTLSLCTIAFATTATSAFTAGRRSLPLLATTNVAKRNVAVASSSQSSSSSSSSSETSEASPLGLTPELRRMTNAFESIGDDKLRYKQLLYMANQLEPLANPAETCVPENKVPGCLSTVYVDGTATWDDDKQQYVIQYVGDSDGLLTKGLVALLVRGLSGCTAEEIQKVDPKFIQQAKISQSLTPGRNNGFLNMLAVMKRKALELEDRAKQQKTNGDSLNKATVEDQHLSDGDRPMYTAMVQALQVLKPTRLELVDNSHQHAGHAGSKGFNGESHFDLEIVADAFDGLNLVKRHKLIYMLLGEVMPKIHALRIKANTPEEVGE